MERKITCIECPVGCIITIQEKNGHYTYSGADCKLGENYAYNELINPRRILTTTVIINNSPHQLLPVKSKEPFPKQLLCKAVQQLASIKVTPPIQIGDVIYSNLLNTGIDIIATSEIQKNT